MNASQGASNVQPIPLTISQKELFMSFKPTNLKPDFRDTRRKDIESWDASKVNKWLTDQAIDKAIKDHFGPCTGEYLSQLNQLQIYSPQFFYQTIYNIEGLSNTDAFLKFSLALKKLFA